MHRRQGREVDVRAPAEGMDFSGLMVTAVATGSG
jgi:hypothetical protein